MVGAVKIIERSEKMVILGIGFLVLLLLSYVENRFFFSMIGNILQNQLLAIFMLFMNDILVVSLILLGMTFYVNLVVLNFFKREKHADMMINHPKTFALIFTFIIVFLSILRGATLIYGGINLEVVPIFFNG
jgi:hypothetical protein